MARKLTSKTAKAEKKDGEISADDMKREIANVNRQKANAAEYAGHAGQAAKNAIERYGLDRTAFTFVTRLSRMEETKRDAAIRSTVVYASKAGMFDQLDAFSNFADVLEEIAAEIRGRRPSSRGAEDAATSALIN